MQISPRLMSISNPWDGEIFLFVYLFSDYLEYFFVSRSSFCIFCCWMWLSVGSLNDILKRVVRSCGRDDRLAKKLSQGRQNQEGSSLNLNLVFISTISQSVFLYDSHTLFITVNLFLKMFRYMLLGVLLLVGWSQMKERILIGSIWNINEVVWSSR